MASRRHHRSSSIAHRPRVSSAFSELPQINSR
jgi:hypothetical protein